MASPNNTEAKSKNASNQSFNFEMEFERLLLKVKPFILPIIIIILIGIIICTVTIMNKKKKGKYIAEAYAELQEALAISLDDSSDQESLDKNAAKKREILDNIIANYSDTPAAIEASFYKATIHSSLKNYIDAIAGFNEFYKSYPNVQPFSIKAKIAEANSYLAQQNFAEATSKFKVIVDNSQNAAKQPHFMEQAKFQLVLCNLLTDNFEESTKLLNDILASSNDDVLKEKAQSILAKLEIVSGSELKKAILPLADSSPVEDENSAEDSSPVEEENSAEGSSTAKEKGADQGESTLDK